LGSALGQGFASFDHDFTAKLVEVDGLSDDFEAFAESRLLHLLVVVVKLRLIRGHVHISLFIRINHAG
jgi:hypothetical protein